MFTFADLLGRAQGGQALDTIAAAYGLKRSDLDALSAALLPALQIGLQRRFADPSFAKAPAELFDPATFGAAFEDAHAALSPAATEAGRMALERLFGSPEAARVVADQVSAMSGVGADVVGKVMPTLAATVLGGIGKSIEDSPLRPLLKAWSGGIDPAEEPLAAFVTPYRDAMAAFLKGYASGKARPEPETPGWAEGMQAFGRLFQAGVDISEQNRKAFEQILDGARKG
jgi:hypothetical protein